MNLAELSLRNRVTTLVLTVVLFLGGIQSFQQLSRLEDPEFTIKDALVFTPYSGAAPVEVEQEVTEKIERAVQQMAQIKEVESRSERGLSTVTVTIQDQYGREALPQVWDELRRKINDIQGQLPPKAGPSLVNDDFGDVFGVFVALYGPGYSYAELKEVAQMLRREYLLVPDVAKVDFWGDRQESIHIEMDRDRAAQLGVTPASLQRSILDKNLVVDAGRVEVGGRFIDIDPTGTFPTAESIADMLIRGESDAQFYLRDIATVTRGYVDPPTRILRYDGQPAVGIGVSTASGGNVVTMGEAIRSEDKRNPRPAAARCRVWHRLPAVGCCNHRNLGFHHQPVAGRRHCRRGVAGFHGPAQRSDYWLHPGPDDRRHVYFHGAVGRSAGAHLAGRTDYRAGHARG